jgi:drug/metabolite transporter (DMT)-like permease
VIFDESPSGLQLVGVAAVLAGLLVATRPARGRIAARRRAEVAESR